MDHDSWSQAYVHGSFKQRRMETNLVVAMMVVMMRIPSTMDPVKGACALALRGSAIVKMSTGTTEGCMAAAAHERPPSLPGVALADRQQAREKEGAQAHTCMHA